jgi:alkyl sulfatase BDS1-like metallo-beta-lactamase superfamily hydrolase
VFEDLARTYVMNLENCALTYLADGRSDRAEATVTLDRAALDRVLLRELPLPEALPSGQLRIDGDPSRLTKLFGLLDTFNLMLDVVDPNRPAG